MSNGLGLRESSILNKKEDSFMGSLSDFWRTNSQKKPIRPYKLQTPQNAFAKIEPEETESPSMYLDNMNVRMPPIVTEESTTRPMTQSILADPFRNVMSNKSLSGLPKLIPVTPN